MSERPSSDVAFSSAVKAEQERRGSRRHFAALEAAGGFRSDITPELAAFLGERDSVYLGTASAAGQPYIQHRGGPKGFLKVLGPRQIGFADFAGNRQYITLGNLAENDRLFLFCMDYALRQRVKLCGRGRVVEDDQVLLENLIVPGYKARAERAIVIDIEAWDANCRQHILPRYDESTLVEVTDRLVARIQELEAEVEALKRERS